MSQRNYHATSAIHIIVTLPLPRTFIHLSLHQTYHNHVGFFKVATLSPFCFLHFNREPPNMFSFSPSKCPHKNPISKPKHLHHAPPLSLHNIPISKPRHLHHASPPSFQNMSTTDLLSLPFHLHWDEEKERKVRHPKARCFVIVGDSLENQFGKLSTQAANFGSRFQEI